MVDAGAEMVLFDQSKGELTGSALFGRQGAARGEPAALGEGMEIWRCAGDRFDGKGIVDIGDRPKELKGIGVPRIREEALNRPNLHDIACIHDCQGSTRLGDDSEIVRDQQKPEPRVISQAPEQFQDLVLNRDVQRCRWLVTQQDPRLGGQRDRYQDALPRTARQLMGIGGRPAPGIGDSYLGHEFDRFFQRSTTTDLAIGLRAFSYLIAYPHHRVERTERFLEDDADPTSDGRSKLSVREHRDLSTLETYTSRDNLCVAGQQPQDRPERHRLAAPRFTYQSEGLAIR
jgi:hypothetical protein